MYFWNMTSNNSLDQDPVLIWASPEHRINGQQLLGAHIRQLLAIDPVLRTCLDQHRIRFRNSLTAEATDYKEDIMTSGHALFNPDHRFGSAKQCAATLRVPWYILNFMQPSIIIQLISPVDESYDNIIGQYKGVFGS